WLGLIVLGPKLSDEPYSREDKQLLGSVASQAALGLESITLAEQMAERMEADRRVQQEMEIARAVQNKLLPQSFLHSPHWITPEHAFRPAPWAATTTTFLTLGQAALVLFWPTLRGKEFPAHCSWPTFRPASAACTP